jgi:signal transduction histidine kinase
MTSLILLSKHPLIHAFGWTLLNFLWQGAIIALLLKLVLRLLMANSSQLRYMAACCAMGLMVIFPLATFAHLAIESTAVSQASSQSKVEGYAVATLRSGSTGPVTPWMDRIAEAFDSSLPWLLTAWLAGTTLLMGRLNIGLIVAWRMKSTSAEAAPVELRAILNDLSSRMGIVRRVGLLNSALVQVPTVIGWLRPAVLIPVGCLAGLSPTQIEAIFAHELAHRGVNHFAIEHRLLMPDHSVKYLHLIAHGARDNQGRKEYIGAVQDVTQRRLSEEALGQARSELAKVARVMSLGVLTASIAHEVNQPLSGIVTNAGTCLRMLSADPPNVDGARETARRTIRDGNRAADIITRLRTLYSTKDLVPELMDLNEAAREVTSLSLSELQRNGVILRHEFADELPPVTGDRVQLQQVILNLVRNASDAMSAVDGRPRELLIRTEREEGARVRLSVKDAGVGLTPEAADKLFEAFYTTKSDGMGIGLSISRSIIDAHQGRLWATANHGPETAFGATFSFCIPCQREAAPAKGAA